MIIDYFKNNTENLSALLSSSSQSTQKQQIYALFVVWLKVFCHSNNGLMKKYSDCLHHDSSVCSFCL